MTEEKDRLRTASATPEEPGCPVHKGMPYYIYASGAEDLLVVVVDCHI